MALLLEMVALQILQGATTEPATETSSETSHSVLLEKVTRLLQAQAETMTA